MFLFEEPLWLHGYLVLFGIYTGDFLFLGGIELEHWLKMG